MRAGRVGGYGSMGRDFSNNEDGQWLVTLALVISLTGDGVVVPDTGLRVWWCVKAGHRLPRQNS